MRGSLREPGLRRHLFLDRLSISDISFHTNNFDSPRLFEQIPRWTPRQRCWKTHLPCRRSRRIPRTRRIPNRARPIPRSRRSLSRPPIKKSATMRSHPDQRPDTHCQPGSRASGYDRPTSWSASASSRWVNVKSSYAIARYYTSPLHRATMHSLSFLAISFDMRRTNDDLLLVTRREFCDENYCSKKMGGENEIPKGG